MCGIFAYFGDKQALPFLIDGLSKLDYRGYDSFGFCLKEIKTNGFNIFKKEGKLEDNLKNKTLLGLKGELGISHTRWATHGKATALNSHPHFDCQKQVAVVHNGIIENYLELKKKLKNHKFVSETDTEVIPHLIESCLLKTKSLEQAVLKAVSFLKGSYAFVVLSGNKLIAVCNDCPLILGKGFVLASDINAIQGRDIIPLDKEEILVLEGNKARFFDFSGKELVKKWEKAKGNEEAISKQSFDHFMLKEIFEQEKTIPAVFQEQTPTQAWLKEYKRLVITGCGTSYFAALLGKILFEKYLRIPTEAVIASEFNPLLDKETLLICISQSGETADTLRALRLAKSKKIKVLSILNRELSTMARETDFALFLKTGPEISVVCTKAFTATLAVFLKMAGRKADLEKEIKQILAKQEELKKLASLVARFENCLFLGRGLNLPIALEGALKLKEASYIHAEGYGAGEIKHGPLALVDEKMLAIFLATENQEKLKSNLAEVRARRGKTLVFCDNRKDFNNLADWVFEVPKTKEEFSPLMNVIALQLLAYLTAVSKGLNPDKPRNLAKSVTVE